MQLLAIQTAHGPATIRETAQEIGADCDRALRRLDRLIGERDDVVLTHVRAFVEHAARLSEQIECSAQ
jgi:class 3 adenylate cyclase